MRSSAGRRVRLLDYKRFCVDGLARSALLWEIAEHPSPLTALRTVTGVGSYDTPSASSLVGVNGPASGDVSVTVVGSGVGLEDYTSKAFFFRSSRYSRQLLPPATGRQAPAGRHTAIRACSSTRGHYPEQP